MIRRAPPNTSGYLSKRHLALLERTQTDTQTVLEPDDGLEDCDACCGGGGSGICDFCGSTGRATCPAATAAWDSVIREIRRMAEHHTCPCDPVYCNCRHITDSWLFVADHLERNREYLMGAEK